MINKEKLERLKVLYRDVYSDETEFKKGAIHAINIILESLEDEKTPNKKELL